MHASHNNEQNHEYKTDSIMLCGGDIEHEESAYHQEKKRQGAKKILN